MPRAAIDIGSNSLLLTVTTDDGTVLTDLVNVVGLGRDVGDDGALRADRMDAAVEVLTKYAAVAEKLGVPPHQVVPGATSACRRATNGAAFIERVKHETGLQIRLLSGDEEARCTTAGALSGLSVEPGKTVVIDPGGGSTEFALCEHGEVLQAYSTEIGSVRLMDAALGWGVATASDIERARGVVQAAMKPAAFANAAAQAVGVAGTVTSLAAAELGLHTWDSDAVHGFVLTRHAIQRWIKRLAPVDVDARRALLPATPDRAATLLAGALVIDTALDVAGVEDVRVSVRGLRFGLLTL